MATKRDITKSQYMNFLRHPAWGWLDNRKPWLLPPVDDATQATLEAGHAFEPYVEARFPEGERLGFDSEDERRTLPERTRQALGRRGCTLFQAGFEADGFRCISDIVQRVDDGVVDIYEIKASTRAKAEHAHDLAFQTAIIEANGYTVRDAYVVHVNNRYARRGEIDHEQLATITRVTEEVEALREEAAQNMTLARRAIDTDLMPNPDPSLAGLGARSEWQKLYDTLYPPAEKIWSADIEPTIDREKLTEFLGKLKYPLYFFDYETMQSLIPRFDGHKPYQQVPFQYSLHVIHQPGGEIEHLEYLHDDNSNPSLPITEQLISHLGDRGSIVTWNQAFEKGRNRELAEMHPQYAAELEAINNRVVDLMIPFKAKWYDDPRFEGSASIKKVLPVLCPELSYQTLGIQEGNSAQRLWMSAVLDDAMPERRQQILDDLIEYCKMDTWAMVEIHRVLAAIVDDEKSS